MKLPRTVTPPMLAALGLAVVAVSGTGIAVAAGSASTITVCVHKKGHAVYTGPCAKGDGRLSWSKIGATGPAGATGPRGATGTTGASGPGAYKLVNDQTGVASAVSQTVGAIGPYTLSAICSTGAAGETGLGAQLSGPAGQWDGLNVISGTPLAFSVAVPAIDHQLLFKQLDSTSTTPDVASSQFVLIPTVGHAESVLLTAAATGGATNKCHVSAVVTPVF